MTAQQSGTGGGEAASSRLRPVVDLDDGLLDDLIRVEELLLTLRRWADEAAGPDGDGWAPPGPLAGDTAVEALRRLYDALRPTQSHRRYDLATRNVVESPPGGPRWYAANGRTELAAISFVDVDDADVALLTTAAGELGRPGGDPGVREAIEWHEDDRPSPGGTGERERRGLVVTAARVAGMLDLEPTADTEQLLAVWQGGGDRIVLDVDQEQAYHRLVDRLNAIGTLGDPLIRWAIGPRAITPGGDWMGV